MTTESDPYRLQTLARGAAVLNLLTRRDSLTLKEVSSDLGLDPSTTYRVLRTWASTGFLSYDATTKRYYAGLGLLRLATKSHSTSGLPAVEERLGAVSRMVEQTASFSILSGRFVLYVARVVANRALMYQVEIGKTLPAYSTSAGHVLLAFESPERILELYPDSQFLAHTESTIRTREELIKQLQLVRENGYALNRGQHSDDVAALAVPVRDGSGRVVGSFSLAGAVSQFSDFIVHETFLPALLEAAREPLAVVI